MNIQLEDKQRLIWTIRLVVIGFLCGIALSLPLWLGSRSFPYSPVLGLGVLSKQFETILFIILVFSFVGLFAVPLQKKWIFVVALTLFVFAIFDQLRWNAVFYQYTLILLTLLTIRTSKGAGTVLNTIRVILAATYFWAGIQKLHITFIAGVFPWMMGTFLPESLQSIGVVLGFVIPVIEASIGIALLSVRYRKFGLIAAISMHLFILLHIGPLGRNYNIFVWPWNLVMPCVAFVVYSDVSCTALEIIKNSKSVFHKSVLVLVGIMPALNFFNLWDSYLSFSLYTGNVYEAKIDLLDSTKKLLPEKAQRVLMKGAKEGQQQLDIVSWSFSELGLPPYPERRIYLNIFNKLCAELDSPQGFKLRVLGRPNRINGKRNVEHFSCRVRSFYLRRH